MKTLLKCFMPIVSCAVTVAVGQSTGQTPVDAGQAGTAQLANGIGPRIRFEQTVYDFGRVNAGAVVKCEFVFTNEGDATLEIIAVHTSCGCTTAGEWPREVPPGKTGRIPIQFNTGGFGGHVMKTVTVASNDKEQPSAGLQVRAMVWKPVDVIPQFAVIYANAETLADSRATVRIVNNEELPLEVSAPECNNEFFTAELKTNSPGKEFELVIKAVPQSGGGNRQGLVTLKTSSTNTPQINIVTMVILQPVLTVSPPQINLPAGPLAEPMTFTVSVRNSGTNVLTLAEPAVNSESVRVEIKEAEPGRAFNVAVSFPAGFETKQGVPTEASFKSNHPEFPVIKVPVVQPPRPAQVTAAAEPATGPIPGIPPMPLPPQ